MEGDFHGAWGRRGDQLHLTLLPWDEIATLAQITGETVPDAYLEIPA